ncbi:sensor histidine kinase [Pedobacter gandavensis]|uniref:Sensor histidine kinase n=1 Tax=Pedobacter gandavensis TaxID=2679963 RepID=A0ABR6EWQ8_9SPHI|nr:histidine kinase [Pedobacter gandavensis]MBB2149718.1 sensor histidine kinase [Pedobacter gandavensis]
MKTKAHLSLYWKCQLAGWTIASLYWTLQGFLTGGFRINLALVQLLSDVLIYILITHLYRNFSLAHHWEDLDLRSLLIRILPAVLVMGILYTLITILKLYGIRILFQLNAQQSIQEFLKLNGLGIFMAGIRLMAIWLLAYHLYHYAKRALRMATEKAKIELSLKQTQLDHLHMQLNPHFLFNSLNTIKSLIYTSPNSAGRGIDLLTELLRAGLYKGETLVLPLEEELSLVKDYLELEQLRMGDRLTFKIASNRSFSNIQVPRMCIQGLVENAVKHGVAVQKNGGFIQVLLTRSPDFMCIEVISPGRLSGKNTESGIGLKNLEERLKITYAGNASFDLYELEAGQVCAVVKIPTYE